MGVIIMLAIIDVMSKVRMNLRWTTGLSVALMAIIGGLAFTWLERLHIVGDPVATSAAVQQNLSTLYIIFIFWLVVALLDIVVSAGLFFILRSINIYGMAVAAGLRLVYTLFLTFAATQLFFAANDSTNALDYFEGFNRIWSLGLIIFRVHLVSLGIVDLQSILLPRVINVLLILAGVGYIVTHTLSNIPSLASLDVYLPEFFLAASMIIGELALAFWLLTSSRFEKLTERYEVNSPNTRRSNMT
jgi:hypothetical protein